MKNIVVTGGAGFIGSFLTDKLIEKGHDVTIIDNLEPQVHHNKIPDYLNKKAKFIQADVNDQSKIKKAFENCEVVFHLAAIVGVGQSMYEINKYTKANILGTSNILDFLVNSKNNIQKLIVASSMSIYGEGSYKCPVCGVVSPKLRTEKEMMTKDWELSCPKCRKKLIPIPTSEEKTQDPTSIYAITKKTQEDMCLNIGKSYNIPTVALRFFNVYGPRQSLNNPYTGVAAIFMSRIKNNKPPIINEDGNQTRDFISVHDLVDAIILAMEKDEANYNVFNVGAGSQISINEIAEILLKLYKSDIKPKIANQFRKGDIRHCFADISKIKSKLGFQPKISLEDGMKELIAWSENQEAKDTFDATIDELKTKELLIKNVER